ncbi:MAG: hypothetical protein ACTHKQ_05255 [Mesorhizobium sp.]
MRDIGENLHQHERRISGLENVLRQMAQAQQARTAKQFQEMQTKVLIDVLSAGYERSAAYTNVIMVAGYAGIFGIWSFTKDQLSATASVAVALMVGISMLFFVSWELAKMMHNSRHVSKMARVLTTAHTPEQFSSAIEKAQSETKTAQLWFARAWWPILAITILPGLAGGLLLYYQFMALLLGWPTWPGTIGAPASP